MARFAYKAKRGVQETLEGTLEAANPEEALNELIRQGLVPISVAVESAAPRAEAKPARRGIPRFALPARRISSKEILIVTQKLTTMVKASVDLLSSLRILHEQTEHPRLQKVLQEISEAIRQGRTFSDALERFPNLFSPLYLAIVRSGEASGHLDSALEQIGEYLARQESLKSKVSVALAYPILLLLVGMASLFVLFSFVIPKLEPLLAGMGRDLPAVTRVVLSISNLSGRFWLLFLGAAAAGSLFLQTGRIGKWFRRRLEAVSFHLPIVGRLRRNQELAHFARSLSLLLNSGVAALKSLEIATQIVADSALQAQLKRVCSEVASGHSLARSMEGFTGLPRFFTKMTAVGEESGRLTEVLAEISGSYIQQVEADLTLVSSLIEPLMILILGTVMGVVVLSILLPTFQITQLVR